ncbi:MAG TPA: signal peptidase I [Bryobacteraceae bacterium]|jgi:signal peptidase I|nr:signal peptidase I [Bryobacteraceae bacterium]
MAVETSQLRPRLPGVAIAAVVVAFLMAALTLVAATVHASYLIAAVLPIAAAVTILRRRAWGGYGFALIALAQAFIIPALLVGKSSISARQTWLATIFEAGFALLFFFAGRALSRAGAKAGARWPWIALAAVSSVPLLFVRAYVMPTGSMENTLLIGDHLLVRTVPRPAPKRGDLIVFHYPVDRKQVFIKRVIGVAGDRIRMKDRVVYLNGAALREPYVIHRFPADVYRDNLPSGVRNVAVESQPDLLAARTEMLRHVVNGELVVPAGNYFVLGDNRDNSLDSRYWGFVQDSDLIGKPFLIYDSEAGTAAELELGNVKDTRTHIRWNRVFKLL